MFSSNTNVRRAPGRIARETFCFPTSCSCLPSGFSSLRLAANRALSFFLCELGSSTTWSFRFFDVDALQSSQRGTQVIVFRCKKGKMVEKDVEECELSSWVDTWVLPPKIVPYVPPHRHIHGSRMATGSGKQPLEGWPPLAVGVEQHQHARPKLNKQSRECLWKMSSAQHPKDYNVTLQQSAQSKVARGSCHSIGL